MPQQTALNLVDDAILNLDDASEPWSVHLEIRCAGTLDDQLLAAAVGTAMHTHPLARARLLPTKAINLGQHFEIADDVAPPSLEISHCTTDADIDSVRARFQSISPRLDAAPPFAVGLAHHPGGDYLMLNVHHALGDGMSSYRLMLSILRAYAGLEDRVPDIEPLGARDLVRLTGSKTLVERAARLTELARHITIHRAKPVPVATFGATDRAGYGFELLKFTREQTKAVSAKRTPGSTVNDVLLAALAVTVDRWNRTQQAPTGRVGIMMPINLRPAEWRNDVLGNIVSYVTVSVPGEAQADMATAIDAITPQTTRFKEGNTSAALIDLLALPARVVPNALRATMGTFAPLTGGTIVSTAVLSNLGRQQLPTLPEPAGAITEFWFSPPGHMPMGTSIGAVSLGDELFVTLRYRHAQFDAAGASAFAAEFRKVLLG